MQHVVHYINHAGRRLSCSKFVIGARMETTHRKKKNAPPRPHRIRGLQLLDWEARSRYCRWFQRTGVQQISRTTTRVFHERSPVYIKLKFRNKSGVILKRPSQSVHQFLHMQLKSESGVL